MSLRAKFFCFIILMPVAGLGLFLYFATSTFANYVRADVLEHQLDLLNAAHLILHKADPAQIRDLTKSISEQPGYESLIITDTAGKVRAAGDVALIGKSADGALGPGIMDRLAGITVQEGSFEMKDPGGQRVFTSFLGLDLKSERLLMFLMRPRFAALRASMLFFFKAASVLIGLFALLILTDRFIFERHQRGFVETADALKSLVSGKSEAAMSLATAGEFAGLNKQIDSVRGKLKDVFAIKAEEGEAVGQVKAASLLKSRAFPTAATRMQQTEFSAYSEIAKIDGKWWYHFRSGSRLVFISAATSDRSIDQCALISGLRITISLIKETFEDPAKCLTLLNQCICDIDTNKPRLACFVGALDAESGTLTWSNSGFPVPLIVAAKADDQGAYSPRPLLGDKGAPLGEDPRAEYVNQTEQLANGEVLAATSEAGPVLKSTIQGAFKGAEAERMNAEQILESMKKVLFSKSEDSSETPSLIVLKWRPA